MVLSKADIDAITAEALAIAIEVENAKGDADAVRRRDEYMAVARHYGLEKLVRELRHGRNAADA